ncbi:MAG: glycosyltransferase family 4 protein [Gammaproteobacteria bacterium]
MKIVIQHPHRREEISGVLTSIHELLPELLARPGVEVRLVSTKETSPRAQIAAVLWADAVMLNSNCLLMAVAARVFFKRTLLKLHYLQYQTVHLNFERMSFRRRIVAELRHLGRLRSGPKYYAQSVGRLALRTVTAFLVNRVGACSRFCAEQCALPREVLVLRNPIRVPPGMPLRELASLDQPWRFVFIGRIVRDKGWETLIDAASLVHRSSRAFRVDVIGDGPDLQAMKERVVASGLTDHFLFRGRLDPKSMLATLPGALAALMPSRYQEPAGYIPLEAASQRLPCIVSRMGGLPETAGPDCPNFAADRADELAQLMSRFIDEPAKAVAAGHAAYLRAQEQYSPRLLADELMGILMPGYTLAAR